MLIKHTINPVYDKNSKILILGTLPSPKSREAGFYYSHPQNRFFSILPIILNDVIPPAETIDEIIKSKISFLLKHKIALWDVIKSCDIKGADDGSIRNPVPNDLSVILDNADIQAIFTTGKKATELYMKYCYNQTKIETVYLPSTSPANCRFYSFDDMVKAYEIILKFVK